MGKNGAKGDLSMDKSKVIEILAFYVIMKASTTIR